MYRLDGTMLSADPPEGWSVEDPVAFADLSAEYQLAVANGITRTQYVGLPRPPEVPEGVRYQGETFSVHYSVSDYWGTPYETPGGSEWRAPLSLSAAVEDGSFVVSVTNELDGPFPIHHFPRPSPYFGVLVAVSDEPQVLAHDGYDAIEALRTESVVRIPSDAYWALKRRDRRRSTDTGRHSTATEAIPSIGTVLERRQKDHVTWLDPGASVRESYGLSTDLPSESTVWLSLPVGDESTDVTGGRTWQFTATVRLHVR